MCTSNATALSVQLLFEGSRHAACGRAGGKIQAGQRPELVEACQKTLVRDHNSPKPSDIRFPKLEITTVISKHLLSGSDLSAIGLNGLFEERLSEVRDRRSPKPSDIKNQKTNKFG